MYGPETVSFAAFLHLALQNRGICSVFLIGLKPANLQHCGTKASETVEFAGFGHEPVVESRGGGVCIYHSILSYLTLSYCL